MLVFRSSRLGDAMIKSWRAHSTWSTTTSPRFWCKVGFQIKIGRGRSNDAGPDHYGDYTPAGGLFPP
jgi:hypothetical protein